MLDKRTLIRIVLKQDGEVSIDPTGKGQGRGAYICKNAECLSMAIKTKGLEKSFKSAVPKEVYEQVVKSMEHEARI